MEKEKELSSQESLALITSMIVKAKDDYQETGISALFWGSIIIFCSLVTFFNYHWGWSVLKYIWFLTFVAIIPQIFISARERKLRKHKGHQEDLIGGIWISYAIAISLMTCIFYVYNIDPSDFIFLILYGIPTFATGYAKRFTPMIFGGIACWVFSILSFYTPWPYFMLYNAAGALLAWFIPGLIFRKRYLKAKRQHV
jgi:hypothetical protein